ncbi:CoA-transferase family III, partial [Aphelenchoides avenae]
KTGGSEIEQRLNRGKKSVSLDFKAKEDLTRLREMCLKSDVLLDPFRPGVLEAIGMDPVELLKENEGLIVARLTGYGQSGPLASSPGHDINYVALSGLMPTISGVNRKPYWPPANLLADFAGGGLTAAFGIAAALFQRTQNGGKGCIIDCSMTEGLAYLGSFVTMYQDLDLMWNNEYAAFSGNCPVYRTYETKDGKWMAVGALEKKFHSNLFRLLGITKRLSEMVTDPKGLTEEMEQVFRSKTQAEWVEHFKDQDVCVTPVLELNDVGNLEHHVVRQVFDKVDERWVPKPAPRLHTPEEFANLRSQHGKSKL